MDIVETCDAEKVGKDNEVSVEYGCKAIYRGAHEDIKCGDGDNRTFVSV